jgi:energy-coupling factor transport system ATP-binding protein
MLEVEEVTYTYPNAEEPALREVDLSAEEGEFILLTGPSGCGKTTLCRCLNGLIPHFYSGDLQGEVRVLGLSTWEHPPSKLARYVGLIFQNPDNQIFSLTVEKEVAFGLENLGVDREEMRRKVDWALEVVGLTHLRHRLTNELSGGEKQRLAIASILAMRPRVIVLDEPTSFLDPKAAERLFEILNMLNREYGMTILLIEHRVDLAVRYVERVIVMDRGLILVDAPPEEAFTSPKTRAVGVAIPRVLELSERLMRRGIPLKTPPLTPDALLKELTGRLRGDRPGGTATVRMGEGEPIIEVIDVSYTYPNGIKALEGVNLKINRREFIAIMGENGAGKTTLVKHFVGLLKPTEGRVLIDGVDTSEATVASLARKVGLVFQNPDDQLFAESVEEEITFALRNFGYGEEVIAKRVDWALHLLDIERYRGSSPFTLSGGERKRVALASVLAWDPEVVVLDEPTIGQDYAQKERLRHFLMQLRSQGKTTIIVTHDVEFVAECQPRVILMAEGRIVADGPARRVLSDVEVLEKASITPPEVVKVMRSLKRYGLPTDVLDIEEAAEAIARRFAG